MDRAVNHVADLLGEAHHVRRISTADYPELDRRFVLLAQDEAAMRAFLTPQRVEVLAEFPAYCSLDAQGPLLVLGLLPLPAEKEPSPVDLYHQALHLYRAFQD